MAAPVEIQDLRVRARGADGRDIEIVKGVSFAVKPGEVLGLIGESGSGKTTIALSLMGYTRPGCRIAGGTIRVGGVDVTDLDPRGLAALRGRKVAYIAQSAAAAFNPSRTIMAQVIESAVIHRTATVAEAEAKARGLFRALAIPHPDTIGDRYPHQVSGGQLQRLMAAMALITDPDVVVFDEPTTALDVTTQIEVLKAFKAVVRDRGTTGIYVTHDLPVIAQIADRIVVLRDGAIREIGETGALIEAPRDDYTRSLLAAAEPARRPLAEPAPAPVPLLSVEGLTAGYGGTNAMGEPNVPILRDVSFSIQRGRSLGVIGESGCGKSTLARVIAGLVPAARGSVAMDGGPLPPLVARRTKEQLRRIQIVFQMADTALNPTATVEEILGRPLSFYFGLKGEARAKRVRRLLDLTHLPSSALNRRPGDLSGGQKQRVNLARALAAEPDLVLCDEVTSALDTVVAAAILDLLVELRRELGLSYMFISHDLKTVQAICDDVMVLYAGRTVETMAADRIGAKIHHPYTRLLLGSVPHLRPGWLEGASSGVSRSGDGAVVPTAAGAGCAFGDRCGLRIAGTCDGSVPPMHRTRDDTAVACFQPDEALALA